MPRELKLVAFDLDGVLVEEESSWGYLHRVFGTYESISKANYAKAFEQGLISYSEWMKLDLESIIRARGVVYCREIEEAFERVKVADGAREVVEYLRKRGVKTAIVSAGVEYLALRVAETLGIGEVYANKLLCDSGGRLVPQGVEVVNPLKKGVVIERVASKYGVSLGETMYVGDSVWDCSAFEVVGYPVALGSTPIQCASGRLVQLIHVRSLRELELLLKEL